jgi:hypothetical membrane protein
VSSLVILLPAMHPETGRTAWLTVVVVRDVPWWGVVSAAVAPVLLVCGWTVAAGLQPGSFDAVSKTISALAAQGATDRWVMTLVLLGVGTCDVLTGLALRPAASAGRLILIAGGVAGLLVAASPEPARGGGSLAHGIWATFGFVALTAWPVAAAKREPSAPYGLRPAVSAGAAGVTLILLGWFVAELIAGLGQVGLAERILTESQALWPLAVVLSARIAVIRPRAGPRAGAMGEGAGPGVKARPSA